MPATLEADRQMEAEDIHEGWPEPAVQADPDPGYHANPQLAIEFFGRYLRERSGFKFVEPVDPATHQRATDILVRARALIVRGWCQVSFHRQTGWWLWKQDNYCAVGAVKQAALGDVTVFDSGGDPAYNAAMDRLAEAAGVRRYGGLVADTPVFCWNDRWHRTQADVLQAFDEAIG